MQQEFWHERWLLKQIGFHCEKINPHLQKAWPALNLTPGSRVFVPLCGKSNMELDTRFPAGMTDLRFNLAKQN